MLMKREYYKNIANETLEIINKGFYINSNRCRIDVRKEIHKSIEETMLYELDNSEEVNKSKMDKFSNIEIIEGSIIDEIIKIRNKIDDGNIIALNFASAKNPGGGFLNGAMAQEESIARASTLYPCLIKENEFYNYHKKNNNPLYSDKIIYSPNVLIIRNDEGELLEKPVKCSFITSSAVNARVALKRGITREQIYSVMENRIDKIIQLSILKKADVMVLGAFGCGVFGNDADDIAKIFYKKICSRYEELKDVKICFVIYDKTNTIINKFKKVLLQ